MTLDLDNIEKKFAEVISTEEWETFVHNFKEAEVVCVIGNGGQASTAQHASSDATRLIDDKVILSFDNLSYITSVANDFGYGNIFLRWIKDQHKLFHAKDVMVLGLSCSGNSSNIVDTLTYCQKQGMRTAMISGQPSKVLVGVNEVCMNTKYFHSSEILSMLLIYEAIGRAGGRCPTIHEENVRKGFEDENE